jgi:hypothetical protein
VPSAKVTSESAAKQRCSFKAESVSNENIDSIYEKINMKYTSY